MSLPPELQAIDDRLTHDLRYFLKEAPVMVLDKEGRLVNFKLNRAQEYIHEQLEKQKRETGKVRALILKGRQEGCSLYLTARNYHRIVRNPGVSVLLISHEGKATDHLFSMIKRYQKYVDPRLRPEEAAANRNQLKLADLDSQFLVGTAGNEDIGRSGTNQVFHWSEAHYTENARAIQDGAMQTVPDMPGTEIVLESTGNGDSGMFYSMCWEAMHGRGEYVLVFVPWWWMEEYEADSSSYSPLEDEDAYSAANLKEYPLRVLERKLLWRRNKIWEFATAAGGVLEAGLRKFRQIYPANPMEAFQSSGNKLFDSEAIVAARKSVLTDESAPVVIGVDSAGAGAGGDRSRIVVRQGRHCLAKITVPKQANMDMAVAGATIRAIDEFHADMAFVDEGYGHGSIDRMHELGHGRKVMGVGFGERATRPDVFLNKRSEMICDAADWVNGGGVRIPDDDEFHADLAVVPLDNTTSNGLRYIVPKKDIKKLNNGKSTDVLDAFVLTFAYPVRRQSPGADGVGAAWRKKDGGKSPLKSRRR
mgnify:CR=1 FL=1